MDREGLAVSICLGERGPILDEIQEVVAKYRKTLAEYMNWLSGTPSAVLELETICVVRGEDKVAENMTGALSSIISSAGHLKPNKATVVAARARDGGVKVSARAPESLLTKGVDLGAALQSAAAALGGFGGGHNVAAGAHIHSRNSEELYRLINRLVQEQMKKG
jgi:RecJ-like exonuclease